jgi:uncharacterized protein YprB with RNaseH-like and TPR domain
MSQILYLDIETVPKVWNFSELTEREQGLFQKKYAREIDAKGVVPHNTFVEKLWRDKGGFDAEFNMIICVSVGQTFIDPPEPLKISVKSFYGNEEKILRELAQVLNNNPGLTLCAHYGKEFDFPVLSRKFVINRLTLPSQLQTAGKKPWEINMIDTMDLWKFGSYKHSASLDAIANALGFPSPKQMIDGSMVAEVYYEKKWIEIGDDPIKVICRYCEGDVVSLANVHRAITGQYEVILPENVKSKTI